MVKRYDAYFTGYLTGVVCLLLGGLFGLIGGVVAILLFIGIGFLVDTCEEK